MNQTDLERELRSLLRNRNDHAQRTAHPADVYS